MIRWLRLGRLDRLRDRRDDAEYELSKWGFSMTPSECRAQRQRIDRLNERIDRLTTRTEESDRG